MFKKIVLFAMSWVVLMSYMTCLGCSKKPQKTTVTILAAASLTETFAEVEKDFEVLYPEVDLVFNFAGTSTLAIQVQEGLEADVFVAANESAIEELIQKGYIDTKDSHVFAQNELVLIVSKVSTYTINTMDDVLQEGVKIVIGEPAQPIGKYTEIMLNEIENQRLFDENYKALFYDRVVSMEPSVKAVAAKVEMGEADVGIVYGTDYMAIKGSGANKVEIPESCNPLATYELAVLKASKHKAEADDFVAYVLSKEGQEFLLKYGFMLPK